MSYLKLNLFILILIASNLLYPQNQIIKIWPGLAPGSENKTNNEKVENGSVVNVYQPDLTIYLPEKQDQYKPAVIIFPGGGYTKIVIKKEGYDIAEWLKKNGIAAFVLKYRLNHADALNDAQRTLSLIRANAKNYNIDPDKIGVIGFSAGGHLAANLSTHYEKNKFDSIDSVSCKPNFMISVYGAVQELIKDVDKYTPPAFLVNADDDPRVSATQSVNYYLELHKNNVPAELHIYKEGGHGFALRDKDKPVISWANRCIDWMKDQGILSK